MSPGWVGCHPSRSRVSALEARTSSATINQLVLAVLFFALLVAGYALERRRLRRASGQQTKRSTT